jgi:hypothetical protein
MQEEITQGAVSLSVETVGYGLHHQSDDGKYLIMGNGDRACAIRKEEAQEHAAPEKMTVLVVEPRKEPYLKEIDPGLHSLQAEVGGAIAASYPFSDPVGLVCNDEGKLIGLELNRSLRDEEGNLYDIMAGTFLVVSLGEEDFTSPPTELAQKYMEHFKQPEQFINLNGQIIALPVESENPLCTAEMIVEDDYGIIDGVINNGRKGEELEAAKTEAARTSPEKKPPSGNGWRRQKRSAASASPEQSSPEEAPGVRPMSWSKKWRLEWSFFQGEDGCRKYNKICKGCAHPRKQSFRAVVVSCPHYLSIRSKKRRN